MIVEICDFCKKRRAEKQDLKFEHKGKKFRFDISICTNTNGNGIRYKRIDICKTCLKKVIKENLQISMPR